MRAILTIGVAVVLGGSPSTVDARQEPTRASTQTEATAASSALQAEYSSLALQLDAIRRTGQTAQAIPIYTRMAAIIGATRGTESDAYAVALANLGLTQLSQNQPKQAADSYRTANAIILRHHARSEPIARSFLGNLYSAEVSAGETDLAAASAQQILALLAADATTKPADLARWQLNVAEPYLSAGPGRRAEAEAWLRQAYRTITAATGPGDAVRLEITRRLVSFLSLTSRAEDAETLQREVIAGQMAQSKPDQAILAEDRFNLAALLRATGRYREAVTEAQRALALYGTAGAGQTPKANLARHTLVNLYELIGDYASAQPLWEEWLADPFGSQADGTLVADRATARAGLLVGLANNFARQRKLEVAEVTYREAATLAGTNELLRNNIGAGLGGVLMARGDAAGAEPLLRAQFDYRMRAIGIDSWIGPGNMCCATATASAAVELAGALSAQGKAVEAQRLYSLAAATELRFDGTHHPTTSLFEYLHARSLLANDPAAALVAARIALEGARFRRLRATRAASPAEIDAIYRGTSAYFTITLDALFAQPGTDRSRVSEALAVAQEAMVSSTDGAIALMAAERLRKGFGPALGAALARREALAQQAGEIDARLTASLVAKAAADQRAGLVSQLDAVTGDLATTDAAIQRDFPDYYALLRPGPVPLAAAEAALKPDEAVLLFIPGDSGVHALAVTREGVLWRRTTWSNARVDDAARQLLFAAGADVTATEAEQARWDGETGGGADGYPRATAFALYHELVEPLLPALVGKHQVFVAASGRLGAMPFSLLVSGPPVGLDNDPEALRGTHWLVDDFALVQLPSLQSLVTLRRLGARGTTGQRQPFAGFGDPVVGAEPIPVAPRGARRGASWRRAGTVRGDWAKPASALADVAVLRTLDRLGGTATELRRMAEALGASPASLHLAEADTETAVRSADLAHTRILAFATHGLTAADGVGGEPGLVFTPPVIAAPDDDGLLTASEAATLRLDADWVILSACNTAAGMGEAGSSGLTGLARAFFFAGARSVLASYWPVRDDVAVELTSRAIRLQRDNPGMRRADAFRTAMQEIRRDTRADRINSKGFNETWAQPNAWAPFMLVGAGPE